MRAHPQNARSDHRWRIAAWSAAALPILLPLLIMQITDQVDWGVFDLIAAATLAGILGLAWELTMTATQNRIWRRTAAMTLAVVFLLVWAELAVGIF